MKKLMIMVSLMSSVSMVIQIGAQGAQRPRSQAVALPQTPPQILAGKKAEWTKKYEELKPKCSQTSYGDPSIKHIMCGRMELAAGIKDLIDLIAISNPIQPKQNKKLT